MTDAVPIEEPVPPVPEAVAEVEAAPPEAAVPASAEVPAAALFEIEHPIGPVRQGVLDHLVDSEGPQTVAQIIAGLGNYSRGTIESAIKREFDAGRIERVAPGTYRLAPPRPESRRSRHHRQSQNRFAATATPRRRGSPPSMRTLQPLRVGLLRS